MSRMYFHRFEEAGQRFAIDVQTCFCFECDDISWDVLNYYPEYTINAIKQQLADTHPAHEVDEVVGELEWLRSTKAILPPPKIEEMQKQLELNRDLHTLDVVLAERPAETQAEKDRPDGAWSFFRRKSPAPARHVQESHWEKQFLAALNLLYARSGHCTRPTLVLRVHADFLLRHAEALAQHLFDTLHTAISTGKQLRIAVHRTPVPQLEARQADFMGHDISVQAVYTAASEKLPELGALVQRLERLAKLDLTRPKALAVFALDQHSPDESWVVLHPGNADVLPAVRSLMQAKLNRIELDLETAYQQLDREAVIALMQGLKAVAEAYADRLLKRENIRLEPLASLFKQIYEGQAQLRGDPAGLHRLAIDAQGRLYPGAPFFEQPAFQCGDMQQGDFDSALLGRFEDVGALTTPECMRCWAQSLCGGGMAAVHQAWSGDFRQPDSRWCDAQRSWLESAVVAFNTLSTQGVNFTRLYEGLQNRGGASVWKMLKAAWSTRIIPRSIQEADAPMLKQWENWNASAYFLSNESGLFLATQYDREMDSLHPRGTDQEFILTRRNGTPMGLIKLSPSQLPLGMWVWVHFREPADYAKSAIQQSFRQIMTELTKQQQGNGAKAPTLFTPVGPEDPGLGAFLEALGFRLAGVQREALYLHGAYRDISLYTLSLHS